MTTPACVARLKVIVVQLAKKRLKQHDGKNDDNLRYSAVTHDGLVIQTQGFKRTTWQPPSYAAVEQRKTGFAAFDLTFLVTFCVKAKSDRKNYK